MTGLKSSKEGKSSPSIPCKAFTLPETKAEKKDIERGLKDIKNGYVWDEWQIKEICKLIKIDRKMQLKRIHMAHKDTLAHFDSLRKPSQAFKDGMDLGVAYLIDRILMELEAKQ